MNRSLNLGGGADLYGSCWRVLSTRHRLNNKMAEKELQWVSIGYLLQTEIAAMSKRNPITAITAPIISNGASNNNSAS